MSLGGPPHLGARPEAFEFPFAAAGVALAAIEGAVVELRALLALHEDEAAGARVDFEGEARSGFDSGLQELMAEISALTARLQRQWDELSDEVAEARRRREASLDAAESWDQALRRHEQDLADQPP